MYSSAAPERDHQAWIDRLRQIDTLLEATVPTLIRVADWSNKKKRDTIPLYISEREGVENKGFLLAHALYSSTIQRLNQVQRRFAWLNKDRKSLGILAKEMPKKLLPDGRHKPNSLGFLKYVDSELFGALNPLTSSEIFWAFIRAGETYAHSGLGFLAFFGILWSLERRFPDKNKAGASLEPSGPTATTTAKCLIVVHSLCEVLHQRAMYYDRVAKQLGEIGNVAGKQGAQATWDFAAKVDQLAATLFALSPYTILEEKFVTAGKALLKQTRALHSESNTTPAWMNTRAELSRLLKLLNKEQRSVFADSHIVVKSLLPKIIECLKPNGRHADLRAYCTRLLETEDREYWKDHARAATKARSLCAQALNKLQSPFRSFRKLGRQKAPPATALIRIFKALCKSNTDVATLVHNYVREPVEWCRRIINEETARASAGNLTEFDPAGLISAVTIAHKWDCISDLEAKDAIGRALAGALKDGSWMRGQPMFLQARSLGVWPHTPDIVWMLAQAVNADPKIKVADDTLLGFVDWLDRTKTQFRWKEIDLLVQGWSSELDRVEYVIDFWNTNVSINALLDIRELIETRLWQICTGRFTTLRPRSLEQVAPVDLGAIHEKRLHRRLMTMARLTQLASEYGDQDYALVLHGPPGSSKTAIVEGLGGEMWRGVQPQQRIVRITPSDFTRQGEAGLDFEARFIFDLLSHLRGVTILFDEIDDFLRQRIGDKEPSFIQLITPAMLNRLQDLRDAAPRQQLCFVLATNFIDKIEPAMLRPGRVDGVIPISYPDAWSRQAIYESNAKTEVVPEHLNEVINGTIGWPWSTYNKLTKQDEPRKSIKEFEDQVQDPHHYYEDNGRLEKNSAPLANEYIHLAFCESKDRKQCRSIISGLEVANPAAKTSLLEIFGRQVAAEGRFMSNRERRGTMTKPRNPKK
jgi:hypothetical protein